MKRTAFLFFALFSLVGCSGQTLDGGSNAGDGGAPASSSSSGSSSGGTSEADAEAPLTGTIAGRSFTPVSVELSFKPSENEWFLQLRNYRVDCDVLDNSDTTPDEDRVVVTVADVKPQAGTDTISYGDSHKATFQVGVFRDGTKPSAKSGKTGTLRIDAWNDDGSAPVTGHLELSNDESSVSGTFSAKVCAKR